MWNLFSCDCSQESVSGGEEAFLAAGDAARQTSGRDTSEQLAAEEQEVIKSAMDGTDGDKSLEAEKASLLFVTLFDVQRSDIKHMKLPEDTLYSATVAIPMIARSSGYPLTLTSIAVKMVVLNLFCMGLQTTLLMSLVTARWQLPERNGVPSLCTYGQDLGNSSTPRGPNGIILERRYENTETDYTMLVVRNNLMRLMEHLDLKSDPSVGPVEYGSQSATCRIACIAVFTITVCRELFLSLSMCKFLYVTPSLAWGTNQAPWVKFQDEVDEEVSPTNRRNRNWRSVGKSNLDYVSFVANGVPWSWKLFSGALLGIHFIIIANVFYSGVVLLLNTGGIVDVILDSVAATFIMELDRLMFHAFTATLTKDIMHRLEPFIAAIQIGDLQEGYQEHQKGELDYSRFRFMWRLTKAAWPMSFMLGVTFLAHFVYFYTYCDLLARPFNLGDWFSEPYFQGQTRFFGGWEFWFGSWTSKNVTFNGTTLCKPAHFSADGKKLTEVKGCGWPANWTPGTEGQ